jgi:hypothetical protein
VVVEDLTEGTCHKPRAERIRPEACVRLSQAMTASGVGLDLDSLAGCGKTFFSLFKSVNFGV